MKKANSDHFSFAVDLLNLDLERTNPSQPMVKKKEGGYSTALGKCSGRKKNFPSKLFDVISDEAHSDIVQWLPGGKAFIIHDKKRFASDILPRYFKQSQFTSFTRKLTRWNFQRVTRGLLMGAYFHKHFQEDNPSLCRMMSCKDSDSVLMETSHIHRSDVLNHSSSNIVNHSSKDLMSLMMYKQSVEEVSAAQQVLQVREQHLKRLIEVRRRQKACKELELRLLHQTYDQSPPLPPARNFVSSFDANAEMNARIIARARLLARARLSAQAQARAGFTPPTSVPSSLVTATENVRSERELLRRCYGSSIP